MTGIKIDHDDWYFAPGEAREAPVDGGVSEARLDALLGLWADWMSDPRYGRGYPSRSPGLRSGKGRDFDDWADAAEIDMARAIDAILDDLDANQRIAVHHRWLASVWRLRLDMGVLYDEARTAIRAALKRRGLE